MTPQGLRISVLYLFYNNQTKRITIDEILEKDDNDTNSEYLERIILPRKISDNYAEFLEKIIGKDKNIPVYGKQRRVM